MAAARSADSAILLYAAGAAAAQALAAALGRGGYPLTTATCEEEALQALEDRRFDLVLVHLHRPDPWGLDVIKLLRMSGPSEPLPPVIVLADAMSADVQQACADARVDLALTSPIEPRYLLDYVGDLLARDRTA